MRQKKVTKEIYAFKAILKVENKKGDIEETSSDGLADIKHIRQCNKLFKLPNPNKSLAFKSDELKEMIRLYGYPFFSNSTKFLNQKFNVYDKFKELIKNNQISFDDIYEGISENIIFFDYKSHMVRSLNTMTPINQAANLERIGLTRAKYKNYDAIIDMLIDNERIIPYTHNGIIKKNYNSEIFGSFIFSDEEFYQLHKEIKKVMHEFKKSFSEEDVFFDYYYTSEAFEKINLFNLNKHLRTQQEIDEMDD